MPHSHAMQSRWSSGAYYAFGCLVSYDTVFQLKIKIAVSRYSKYYNLSLPPFIYKVPNLDKPEPKR